ncbi:MAG: AMP-binding protein, partial [bacterium]|nr:AMP-binding protein [bacterium]
MVNKPDFIRAREDERLLLTGAFIFDISTFEMWWPLLNGVRLVLPEEEQVLEAEKLAAVITANKITILHLIPQLFNQLAQQDDRIFAHLNYFLVGGDLVGTRYVNRIRKKYPDLEIRHMYGPTENTTFSTYLKVEREYPVTIPIGRPVNGCSVCILDRYGQLQPIGVAGELCVGGTGVARGYLNQQQLTGEKFVSHPLVEGEKIYCTGDLARWLPDGNIEFLGRKDFQVKIRGFRIELGEIQRRMEAVEAVKEAVVFARDDPEGNKYLVGYYVCEKSIDNELLQHLGKKLPAYMIPSYFVLLKEMPLTAAGKIDRKALPAPEATSEEKKAAPKNENERILVEIWQEVLGSENVGTNENFFMIGGDSIKAIQISTRVSKGGFKVEVKDIFRNPTISELALCLRKPERIASQETVTGRVPLTPIQAHFFDTAPADRHHFNISFMLYVGSENRFDKDVVEAVFRKLQEHHDALRMSYKEQNGKIIQECHGLDYPLSLQEYDYRDEETHSRAVEKLESKAQELQ